MKLHEVPRVRWEYLRHRAGFLSADRSVILPGRVGRITRESIAFLVQRGFLHPRQPGITTPWRPTPRGIKIASMPFIVVRELLVSYRKKGSA